MAADGQRRQASRGDNCNIPTYPVLKPADECRLTGPSFAGDEYKRLLALDEIKREKKLGRLFDLGFRCYCSRSRRFRGIGGSSSGGTIDFTESLSLRIAP